ncbi:MAG TPA: hypothetical protein VII51_01310 [Gaiellaceae bacterium]
MGALLALAFAVSGLHGIVDRGPIQPVCKAGTPCTAPAVGAVLVFSRSGRVAARVRTQAGGRYTVRLAAGIYSVRLAPVPRIGGIAPRQVHVAVGVSRRLDFMIDTGIR